MILAINGTRVALSVDDELEDYNPVRTSELVRHCVTLYREALTEVTDAVE